MKYVEDSFSIMVVGKWNASILSPHWIGKTILEAEEVEVQVAVGDPKLPIRIKHDNVLISPSPDSLNISPLIRSNLAFEKAEDVAFKITSLLQYTPVVAYGINFNFISHVFE